MKIRTIAWNTFGSLLRDKLIILFFAVFVCVVLLMMTPMLGFKAVTTASNAAQMQAMVLSFVSIIMSMVSGFGSLLAAWASADAVATEMKSGTILAVMARPVRRWEFLVGKYLGVMMLMGIYVLLMFALSYLLAWMGGERIQSTPWVLIVYPMVRYAAYGAMAMALVTLMHPVVTIGIIMVISVAAPRVMPGAGDASRLAGWIKAPLYAILPSTGLLSEDRFLTITHAALKPTGWLEHATTLGYGLDYALVCLVLAMWSFHFRSLKRD
jgi:ABC-type transport system involved in multi-copper enzyme maturation permease subunit